MTGGVIAHNGIVPTVRKQVIASNCAVCAKVANAVSGDESAKLGIVIAALEIVEAGLLIVDIAAVAERIMQTQCAGHRAGGGEQPAPSVIGVFHNANTGTVQNRHHVALKAENVVVGRTIVYNRQGHRKQSFVWCYSYYTAKIAKRQGFANELALKIPG